MAKRANDHASGANGASPGVDGENGGKPGSNSGEGNATEQNNGTGSTNSGNESATADAAGTADAPKKRRGRKPLPRDEFGNIIRNAGTADASDKGTKERVVVNDRAKVRNNIAGLHAMAAVLTKQPIWNLKDEEANALSNALCDVADYHHIDLIGTGGAFALYASLATTAYMVYVPRFVYMKHLKASEEAKPVNPGEYTEQAETRSAGMKMDFSADTMQ